jgi:hypothetical protein
MQLGTRWAFGEQPPARLPDAVVAAIREVEASSAVEGAEHGSAIRRWTLTWLEGNPYLELDPVDGSDVVIVIRVSPEDGNAVVTTDDPAAEQDD